MPQPRRVAGYSGTPLPTKLGIKEGHRVALLNAPRPLPAGLDQLPDGVTVISRLGQPGSGKLADVIVLFAVELAALPASFAAAARALHPDGGLWVAWPKKQTRKQTKKRPASSPAVIATDVTENHVRAIALHAGLVDNKVCAVDDIWSGLRCVYRLKDRPGRRTR